MTFVPLTLAAPLVVLTLINVSGSPFGSLSLLNTATVTATFFVVLAASSTATGGKLLTIVVTGGVVLLTVFVSSVLLPALATLVMLPRNGAVTTTIRFVLAPAARSPRPAHVSSLPFIAAAGDELKNVTLAGRLSVTERLVAVEGPELVIEIV